MGRPKIGTENEKSLFISARFTAAEMRQIDAAVHRAKVKKSAWIRDVLLLAASRPARAK
jgi:hypothetical protein